MTKPQRESQRLMANPRTSRTGWLLCESSIWPHGNSLLGRGVVGSLSARIHGVLLVALLVFMHGTADAGWSGSSLRGATTEWTPGTESGNLVNSTAGQQDNQSQPAVTESAGAGVVPNEAAAPSSDIDAAAKSTVEAAFEGTQAEPAEEAANPELDWMQKIDQAFGSYVVGPMASVLFYDFGTPKLLGTSVPFIVVWLAVGAIFFTIYMGFINVTGFKHAISLTMGNYDSHDAKGEVSHFQALTSALSGTVGLGNIAGVAIAIGLGGPGATFWIIVVGLLGMTSKFVECTLGQMYRETDVNGQVSGGPMIYLKKGLSELGLGGFGSLLSVMFAILCLGGAMGGGNTFQISQSLNLLRTQSPLIDQHPWIYGAVMAVLVALVVLGGIRSIGKATSILVPFMCVGYMLMAFVIIGWNIAAVPNALMRIITEAFVPNAMYGGFIGVLVIGIKRAVFSNEAGAGSASIAHSAAKTDIPVREGYVALLEPFIDTVIVCTITAVLIVVTGVAEDPGNRALVAADQGAALTMKAVESFGIFKWFLVVCVCLFAYSTCITWYYYGERCFIGLFGPNSSVAFKVIFLTFTFLGSIVNATSIKDFSDMLILGMAFPNMLGMYFLCGKVRAHLTKYQQELVDGKHQPIQ